MTIRLVPHDPNWADIYERAAADIRGALGSTALSVDHVGSSAITGIVAKPVIDVEILVGAYDPEAPYRGPLESLGYAFDHRDESHVSFVGSFDEILFHVHVVEQSSDSRMRPSSANAYANAKSSYVLEIVRRAKGPLHP